MNFNNIFGNCACNPFAMPTFNPFAAPIFNFWNAPTFNPFTPPMCNFWNAPIFNPFSTPFYQNSFQFPNYNFNNSGIWDFPQFNFAQNINPIMFPSLKLSNTDTFTRTTPIENKNTPAKMKKSPVEKRTSSSSLQVAFANKAKSYLGIVNNDREGNRIFSNGVRQAWCADFVTYVARKTFGSRLPSSFGSSSVYKLHDWAINNGCYLKMPSSDKANFIAQNIKVGDIMIEKENGKAHTGIVTKVNPDGSFETIEGNCSNKVSKLTHRADSRTLSGFISLDKYAS